MALSRSGRLSVIVAMRPATSTFSVEYTLSAGRLAPRLAAPGCFDLPLGSVFLGEAMLRSGSGVGTLCG